MSLRCYAVSPDGPFVGRLCVGPRIGRVGAVESPIYACFEKTSTLPSLFPSFWKNDCYNVLLLVVVVIVAVVVEVFALSHNNDENNICM